MQTPFREDEMKIFNPSKPTPCPKCGEDREECQEYRVDTDKVWHFICLECKASWEARIERRKGQSERRIN